MEVEKEEEQIKVEVDAKKLNQKDKVGIGNKMDLQEKAIKRRKWVNEKFGEMTRGKHISNSQKKRMLNKLWRKAKKKYK